jgi:rhodanese-related sulfurtransferase
LKPIFAPVLALLMALIAPLAQATNGEFPGRAAYPDIKTMSVDELSNRLGSVIVVDARSKYEYDTIHITGAVNILVSKTSFEKEVRALREHSKKPIVFYCNGHTCMKSYKAARRAMQAGIEDVYAFDAGIFDWTRAHPDKAALLGQSPVRVNELISKKDFKKRLLEPEEFQKRVSRSNMLVLDVRSRLQRAGAGLFPFDEKFASLDNKEKLDRYLTRARLEGKTVLAYDAVGKQVRWFEYYLRKKGISNYYFMKGGADSYITLLAKQQNSALVTDKTANAPGK